MFKEILSYLKKQNRLTKLITLGFVLIFFAAYSLIGIVYKNYTVNKQIRSIDDEIKRLEEDNLEKQSEILYYNTDAYTEKLLREKLGYQKEGERIYALPRQDPEREKLIREQQKYQEKEDGKPNIIKWYEFFFKKDNQVSKNNGEQKPSSNNAEPVITNKP